MPRRSPKRRTGHRVDMAFWPAVVLPVSASGAIAIRYLALCYFVHSLPWLDLIIRCFAYLCCLCGHCRDRGVLIGCLAAQDAALLRCQCFVAVVFSLPVVAATASRRLPPPLGGGFCLAVLSRFASRPASCSFLHGRADARSMGCAVLIRSTNAQRHRRPRRKKKPKPRSSQREDCLRRAARRRR